MKIIMPNKTTLDERKIAFVMSLLVSDYREFSVKNDTMLMNVVIEVGDVHRSMLDDILSIGDVGIVE